MTIAKASTVDEFLDATARGGSPIGLLVVDGEESAPSVPMVGVQVRRIDGGQAATLPALYRTMATAWDFPEHFGMNKDAFDDCMGDLPEATRGYLTEITDPVALLARSRGQLPWFVESLTFYADEYAPDQQFGVLLMSTAANLAQTTRVWTDAGAHLVRVR